MEILFFLIIGLVLWLSNHLVFKYAGINKKTENLVWTRCYALCAGNLLSDFWFRRYIRFGRIRHRHRFIIIRNSLFLEWPCIDSNRNFHKRCEPVS